jgi:tetratricopeptide (TPR) repeat protein
MSRDLLTGRIGWLCIMGLVSLAYLNGLNAPFVYDDKIEVVGNATIRDLSQLQAVLEYNVSRVWLIVSYAWNYRSFGLDPFGYHVTSLVIHGLAVAAGMTLLVRLGRLGGHARPMMAAIIATGLWAIHPMCTEGVTYITGRSESLCALVVLATLAAWAKALLLERDSGQGAPWSRLWAVLLCVLAMGTKEVALMTPFALLAMERIFGGQAGRRVRWGWYLPFFSAVALGVAGRVIYAEHFIPREVDRPLLTQLTTQAEVWLRYLQLWVFPVKQTLYHHVADVELFSGRGFLAWLGWASMTGAAWWGSRARPLVRFALICAALFLVPSSSVVALKESMAEHRTYVTGFYLFAAAAWCVPARRATLALTSAALLVPVYIGATMARNSVWSSEVALWEEATEINGHVGEAWYGLGDAHRFAGSFDAAEQAYEKALERDPTHLDSWNNLGITRVNTGDVYGAKAAWRSALGVSRTYCKAHANLGFLAHSRGQIEEAVVEFTTTLSYCPNNLVAHYGLGTIYADERRNPKRAVAHFETLLAIEPSFSRAEEVKQRLLELTW